MITQYLYLVFSRTNTKVGKVIRAATGDEYNHAAISFDQKLTEMYAFARPRYHAPLLGRLVHETTGMYTKDGTEDIPIVVYRVPVSINKLDELKTSLLASATNGRYVYNFPSALTYPVFHGIKGDRMYTCSEFVAQCLDYTDCDLVRPAEMYTPEELLEELEPYRFYTGTMLQFGEYVPAPDRYFSFVTPAVVGASVATFGVVAFRAIKRAVQRG